MFKRVALFLATNLAVLALVSIVMGFLGVNANQFGGLLVMAALFGFGGSFVSLLMSKWIAKRTTGAHVIDTPRNESEQWLLATVQRQAKAAGIGIPEVAIYDAPEINAFATGANRNKALVAVSTGLLRAMDRDEAEAVLGHEVSHVANGDMVTMALLQGVLNTFVIVLARIVGRVVDGYLSGGRDNQGGGIGYFAVVFVLDMVFGLFASMIAMWFSRHREFSADAAQAGAGLRHQWRRRPRPQAPADEPSAAGRTHCRIAQRAAGRTRGTRGRRGVVATPHGWTEKARENAGFFSSRRRSPR